MNIIFRVILVAGGICAIMPQYIMTLVGIAACAAVLVAHRVLDKPLQLAG